jgi:hypothetical protein
MRYSEEVKMKAFIMASVVIAVMSLPAMASTEGMNAAQERSFWNPVMVYNDAPYDVQYSVNSAIAGQFYYLNKGARDVYHAGINDTRVYLVVGACTEVNKAGECASVITHRFPNLYNAELISAIRIKSVANVVVTCLDGGATSCLVK